jgi:hypothetical protein
MTRIGTCGDVGCVWNSSRIPYTVREFNASLSTLFPAQSLQAGITEQENRGCGRRALKRCYA